MRRRFGAEQAQNVGARPEPLVGDRRATRGEGLAEMEGFEPT